jgi:hypothetical protein
MTWGTCSEDIRDGTLCLQKSPSQGTKCRDSAGAHQSSSLKTSGTINSIRETQAVIRRRIREIQDRLQFLDQHHVPDSQPWISLAPVSSIEEMGKAKFRPLREALKDDIRVLREYLRDLEIEARKARRSELRSRALTSTGAFDEDLENLLLQAEKTGELDSSQLEGLRSASDRALRYWREAVDGDPSPRNMRGLLSQLGQTMLVGLDEGSDTVREAFTSLRDCATNIKQSAEQRFRARPTVQNFREYCQKAATSLQLGGEGPGEMPAGLPRLRPEKSYVVQAGDSLSAISKMFYGTPSYWDFIFLANLETVGKDPDKLRPNIELQIP